MEDNILRMITEIFTEDINAPDIFGIVFKSNPKMKVVIDFNNTGLEAVHIQVVLRDASGEFSWTPFWLDVDGTYHYSKIVTRQISKIVLFITSINTVPDGTYSGSFVMTNPIFTNLD